MKYHIYDAPVIAAALEASCSTLYSEDMHDGQVIDGLTIRNPFRDFSASLDFSSKIASHTGR